MNYDSMPAGREMDALVAEKAMGWKRISTPEHWKCKAEYALLNDNGPDDPFCPKCMDYPRYSTEIDAAWEVVEKIDSFSIIHNAFYKKIGEEFIVCELTRYEPEAFSEARAMTVPLAICRAALKAVVEGGI